MLRKILIGLAILVILLIGAVVFVYHKISPSLREIEARSAERQKLLQPRVVKGEGTFEHHAFYTGEGLGRVSEIRMGWPADREGADIAVVGSQGADFIDSEGKLRKQIRFSIQQLCAVVVARLSSTGEYGYLTRDESWAVPATFFDKEGHVSWRSDESWAGVDDSVPGDVSGDGRLSVAIGFNAGGGVALLDSQGKRLWKKDEGNVWHIEMLDIKGDGHDKIIHSDAKGNLLVRDAQGSVIARYLPGFYVSWFSLTRWGEESSPTHILVPTTANQEGCCKPIFIVLDANGKIIAERESPLGGLLNQFAATPVHFGKHGDYFAILGSNFAGERSMLLLYDKDGQIVYQEILGDACLGITALQVPNAERLLIGCTNRIWEYSPAVRIKNAVHPKVAGAGA